MKRLVRALATLGAMAPVLLSVTPVAAAGGSGVPFSDPMAHGFIAFCDQHDNPVTSGSIDAVPFVWKAVSSVETPVPYGGPGQNASLTIYQPRQGIPAGDWSGDILTGESFYKYRTPTAVGTYGDGSLANVMAAFPPQWQGLYQLRMQVGKLDYGVYQDSYPTAVIQVTGKTWKVVQGGILPCGKTDATSGETYAHLRTSPSPGAVLNTGAPAAAGNRSAGSTSGSGTLTPGPLSVPLEGASSVSGAGPGHAGLVVGLCVAGLVAGVLGAVAARGRTARRRASDGPMNIA